MPPVKQVLAEGEPENGIVETFMGMVSEYFSTGPKRGIAASSF